VGAEETEAAARGVLTRAPCVESRDEEHEVVVLD